VGHSIRPHRTVKAHNFTFMHHTFLVVTVKRRLKSVYIYGSYRKIKTGVPLFWTTLYLVLVGVTQEHCYCHRRDASLKSEGKAAYATIMVFLTYQHRQHDGSMLFLVRNTVILQCFDAVGWVSERSSGL